MRDYERGRLHEPYDMYEENNNTAWSFVIGFAVLLLTFVTGYGVGMRPERVVLDCPSAAIEPAANVERVSP